MKFVLHSYRRCPFCIRTRILLHLKGTSYDVVEEPLREWTPWMKEWSARTGERARVPVLRYKESDQSVEQIITESNKINLFLDGVLGAPFYTPESGTEEYAEMLAWWMWCDDELKPMIDLYKYGKDLTFDAETHQMHTRALQILMEKLETALAEKKYLLENRLMLADIAIIPFIRQIMRTREGEFDFTLFPRVLAWTNGIIDTDWFQNIVMKKYPIIN